MNKKFVGELVYWKGPAPFYFIPVPKAPSQQIKKLSAQLSYGWGVIPLIAKINSTSFSTALIPKDGLYYLPIKNAVRSAEQLEVGATIRVQITLGN